MAGERFVRISVGARDPERSNGARGAGAAGARFPVLKDNSRGSATRDFGVLSGVDCGVVVEGAKAIVNMAKAWDVLR